MTTERRFYTYAFLREDGTPYYIGKGCGKRCYKNNNRRFKVPPRDRVLMLKTGLTEEEAFRHEVYLIAVLGRKDLGTGILRNLTDGGDGTSGYRWTQEEKDNQSRKHMGKRMSDIARRKMSEAKRGRKLSEETRRKMSEKAKGRKRPFSQASKANSLTQLSKLNTARYRCLVTGHESTPGGLSRYQKARGIDTTLRERL